MEEIYKKLLNSEKLSDRELLELVFEGREVEESIESHNRWTLSVRTVIKVEDRYFSIRWEKANTESQEHYFYEQPEEVKLVEEIVVIKKYV